jgi:hypothetical protein
MIYVLKLIRKIYSTLFIKDSNVKTSCISDPMIASNLIYEALISPNPVMIARFGSTELTCMVNGLGVKSPNFNVIKYIRGETPPWWWEKNIISQMQQWSGFFPANESKIEQFVDLMLDDMKLVDILGSWQQNENKFHLKATKVHLRLLDPFWTENSWMKALEDKKVLIVHPFVDLMIYQYERKDFLFKNKSTLPKFESLQGIKAVQSLGQADNRFEDWFEALEHMKNLIDNCDYDVCLIGAGAYGFPLAAHVKRSGKKAVHIGGSLQLLFGIIGKRWEDPNYGVREWNIPKGSYSNLINDYWVRPGENLKPKNAHQVEGACYW